ncbi:hypothetical protein Tco_1048576 [Tanacetum coccineum]
MVRKGMNEKKGDDAIKGRGDKGSHPLKSILKKTGAPTGGVSSPNTAVNNSNMEDTPVRARRHVIMDPIVNIHEFMSQPGERDVSVNLNIDNDCSNEAAT